MRVYASALLVLAGLGSSAQATEPRITLDLPAGPLSAAVAALVDRTGVNIATSEPALLDRAVPSFHESGPLERLLAKLAQQAKIRIVRLGANSWLLVRAREHRHESGPVTGLPLPSAPITVEGTKQDALLADVPVELFRIAGGSLNAFGETPGTRALSARIPTLGSTDWGAGHDKLFLRGIADSSFRGASPALVGQYWEDQRLSFSAPDPDLRLYDVSSVEVLEGPQGTLYGAGTLGGLIRIQPNPPSLTRFEGWVSAGGSSNARGGVGDDVEAMANLPVVEDRLALRLLGYEAIDPGYIDDRARDLRNINRTRTWGARATLRWRIADGWTLDLGGIAQRIDNRDAAYADEDAPPLTRSSLFAQPSYDRFVAGRMVITGTIGSVTLHSTTGLASQMLGERFEVLQPVDYQQANGNLQYVSKEKTRLLSHETRVSRHDAHGSWVFGISILSNMDRQRGYYGRGSNPPPLAVIDNHASAVTAYGELTRQLLSRFSVTVGVRASLDHLSGTANDLESPFHTLFSIPGVAPQHAASSERHLVPSAGLSYRVRGRMTLFLRYAQGYRPGGLTVGDTVQHFAGDRTETVEAGLRREDPKRGDWNFSMTAATTRWRRVQADLLDGIGVPYITNIGNGRVKSLDLSFGARLGPGWQLDGAAFLARGRLYPTAVIAEQGGADRLPNVARNGAGLSLDHSDRLPGGQPWHAGVRLQHVGHSIFGVGPLLAVPQGGYTTVALGGDIRFGALDLQVNGSNLLNSRHNAFAIGTPLAASVRQQVTPLAPRTLRFGLRYDF